MAFTQDTFAPVGPQSTDAPSVYTYSTPDTLSSISVGGYFVDKQYQLEEGDVIFAQCSDGFGIFDVTSDTGTVTAPPLTGPTDSTLISSKADVIANGTQVSDEITMNQGNYYFEDVDLGTDVIVIGGGTIIQGGTATLSKITTNSTKPTVTVKNGGFAASSIQGQGGFEINNTGGGAAIRVQDTDTICFLSRLLTRNAGCACELNDSNMVIESWTVLSGVNDGIVITGTLNGGPIIRDFNPINILGRMVDIQGSVASGSTRIENLLGTSALEAVRLDATTVLPSMELSGDVLALGTSAIVMPGTISEGLLFNRLKAVSGSFDGCDLTDGYIENFTCTSTGLISGAAGGAGLKGDAGSANIGSAAIVSNCSIQGVGAGGVALSGISKKDLKWSFSKAGPQVVDSVNVGGYTLDAQATTTITYQGLDGSITSVADNGGGFARFTVGTSFANGTPVYVKTATEYDAYGVMANVTATTFDLLNVAFTATDTGTYETGWEKIAGSTTAINTIERFTMSDNNEIRSDDPKTLPMTFTAVISGEKSGATARLMQFALFADDQGGIFRKINGNAVIDATNRRKNTILRIPFDVDQNALGSVFVRNTEGTDDFVCDALSVDVAIS